VKQTLEAINDAAAAETAVQDETGQAKGQSVHAGHRGGEVYSVGQRRRNDYDID